MKAILVVDMPNNCYDCQYCRFDARKYNFRGCVLVDTDVQDGTIDICKEVHSCCPLKPMSEEKMADAIPISFLKEKIALVESWGLYGYAKGLQSAIDEWEWEKRNETVGCK